MQVHAISHNFLSIEAIDYAPTRVTNKYRSWVNYEARREFREYDLDIKETQGTEGDIISI
jgi:hypothetical protein